MMSNLKNLLPAARSRLSAIVLSANRHLSGGRYGATSELSETLSSSGNPIIRAQDVTDYGYLSFTADPFLFVSDETWHLFFEIQNGHREPTAVIGHATRKMRETTGTTTAWFLDGSGISLFRSSSSREEQCI
jgi:hypothetical protein